MKKNLIIIFACYFSILLAEGSGKTMLQDCPNKPNCVSSQAKDSKHYIEPISFDNRNEDIKKNLIEVVQKFDGKILENNENFLKVAFYSKFFKFVDIADFEINPEKKIINVKSAAQTGWYDFGVNRKRIEKIREALK